MDFTAKSQLKSLECVGGVPNLTAYRLKNDRWTIGYGHTRNVYEGMTCTTDQAEQWLDDDLRGPIYDITTQVLGHGVVLTQGEFNALVIWQFNTGALMTDSSLLNLLLEGKLDEAENQMQKYVYVHDDTGKPVVEIGLQRRRAIERTIWYSDAPADPPMTPIAPPATVMQTSIGQSVRRNFAWLSGLSISGIVSNSQDSIAAIQQAFQWIGNPQGILHAVMVTCIVAVICEEIYKVFKKSRDVHAPAD